MLSYLCAFAEGQEPAPKVPTEPVGVEGAQEQAVREVGPPVFLKDKDGRLVRVIDIPYEAFQKFWENLHRIGGAVPAPRWSLQRLSVQGETKGNHAELSIEALVTVSDDKKVRIPLGMASAFAVEGGLNYAGPGTCLITHDPKGDGFVAWLEGRTQDRQEHKISLRVVAPLDRLGGETRMHLALPRSTQSSLKLKVAGGGAIGQINSGGQLASTQPGSNDTTFNAVGLGGDFQLAWRVGAAEEHKERAVYDVNTNVRVIANENNELSMRAEAFLNVQVREGEVEQIRVRCPKNATINEGTFTDYKVRKEDPADDKSPWYVVQLDEATSGAIAIRLDCTWLGEKSEVTGFYVQGAAQQSGHIALESAGGRPVQWDASKNRNISQVGTIPEVLRKPSVVACFFYNLSSENDRGLEVSIGEQAKLRIRVRPVYIVNMQAKQATLEARLEYLVNTPVDLLDMKFPGWIIESLEFEGEPFLNPGGVDTPDSLIVRLPRPAAGKFMLTIKASRDHTAEQEADCPLPVLIGDSDSRPATITVLPATVVVQAADDVEMIPRLDKMTDLSPLTGVDTATLSLPTFHHSPHFYRVSTVAAPAVYRCFYVVHTRLVSVESAGRIHVGRETATIEQSFTYEIDYQRVRRLAFHLPSAIDKLSLLQVALDGVPLEGDALQLEKGALTIVLPSPGKIGMCELSMSFEQPFSSLVPDQQMGLEIPLIRPTGDAVERFHAKPLKWTSDESIRLEAIAVKNGSLPLQAEAMVTLLRPEQNTETVVSQGWVQTILTRTHRQERAVFRFQTSAPQMTIELPAGVADVQVLIAAATTLSDRRRPAFSISETSHELVVPLDTRGLRREFVLELVYTIAQERSVLGGTTIEFPRLKEAGGARRVYWQLITPPDTSLISAGQNFIREERAGLASLFWKQSRQEFSDSTLESWIGASHQPLPAKMNRYLYSSLVGPVDMTQAYRVHTSLLLLLFAGGTLAIGNLLVYVTASRRPVSLMGLGLILLVGTALLGDVTLLATQATMVGLLLLALSKLIMIFVEHRRKKRAVIRGRADSVSTTVLPLSADGSSHATTVSAPFNLPVNAPEINT